jgi:hypothetical protein
MRRIKKFFTAIKALGAFGIILIICVIMIIGSTLAFMNVWLDTTSIYTETMKLTLLEDTVNYSIANEMIEANYYIYTEGEYGEESLTFFTEARNEVDAALAELQSGENYFLTDEELAFVDTMHTAQQDYEQKFEEIKAVLATPDWTWDQILELQASADEQTTILRGALQDLISKIDTIRQEATQTLARHLQNATRNGVISLMFLPFLAIWAFARASRLTQPVLTLTQSAIAIAGDQYRPELLEEVQDRRDGLGQLARAMAHLADTSTAREATLEAEITDLREQLHETRRRKFKPTFPTHDAESA